MRERLPGGVCVGGFLSFLDGLEAAFGRWVVAPLESVIFFDVAFWSDDTTIPIVVLWLILAAVFFTVRFQFVNLRAFRHAVDCARGHYSSPDDPGEISHFQALSAALSATVGLGNIAGVAVAVGLGGPGAVFWMVVAGFLGMSSKFAECTLGQKYRHIDENGKVSGGPMHYLEDGLKELGWARSGRVLALVFSFMCIGGSFGAGNMFQANQAAAQMAMVIPFVRRPRRCDCVRRDSGCGGRRRHHRRHPPHRAGGRDLGSVHVRGLPALRRVDPAGPRGRARPAASLTIVHSAFAPEAAYGGAVGVLIQGFRRAAFSNEAGVGSAPIAHSAAITKEPIREGLVALLEPFIDTIIVCTTTGLVIVVTGAHAAPDAGEGIQMTSWAFATVVPVVPDRAGRHVATLFAFSTMISWSYYGERAWSYLFGEGSTLCLQGEYSWPSPGSAPCRQLDQVIDVLGPRPVPGHGVPEPALAWSSCRASSRRELDELPAHVCAPARSLDTRYRLAPAVNITRPANRAVNPPRGCPCDPTASRGGAQRRALLRAVEVHAAASGSRTRICLPARAT